MVEVGVAVVTVQNATASPVERLGLAVQDADKVTEVIRRMYVGNRPRFAARQPPARFALRSVVMGPLRVDRLRNSFTFAAHVEPFDYLCAFQLLRGQVRLDVGGDDLRLGPGDGGVHLLGTGEREEIADFDAAFLCLPWDRVAAVAEQRTGIDAHDLRLESRTPISAAMGRYWATTVGYLHRILMDPEMPGPPALVAEQLVTVAATAVLVAFPNTSMSIAHRAATGRVAPAVVRRAIAFIDAYAGEPITVADIAAAAGVTPRALQYGFARHCDTSPITYLRRVRLHRAHLDLQAADPAAGDTVAAIAARWGFAKPSRFTALYRQAYHRPPSQTLRT